MTMTPQEKEICRGVIKTMRSAKYNKYNAMFINPFSLDQVPGYLEVCHKKMDIYTLNENLENDVYHDRHAFFRDCFLIFENAIKYHADKDTKWLLSPAREMIKIVKKEQAKAERKIDAAGGGTTAATTIFTTSAALTPKVKTEGTGNAKLKIKLGAGATKPKIKIKTEPKVSQGKTPPVGVTVGAAATPTETQPAPKKPRITLKLGNKSSAPSSASTPKSTTTTASSTKSKGSQGSVSRGKELPKGVAPPETKVKTETKVKAETTKKAPTKKTTAKKATVKATTGKQVPAKAAAGKVAVGKTAATTPKVPTITKKDRPPSKTKITLKPSSKSSKAEKIPRGIGASIAFTPARRAQCAKVLNGLRRRQAKNIIWFERPVSDKNIIQDYRAKIKYPMDLSTMQAKLDGGAYQSVAAFALDLRRIFGNCLQFNTSIADTIRRSAVESFETAEQLLTYFVAKPESPQPAYAPLLFCWKLCLSVLDTLYNMTNPDDKMPTVFYFVFPVASYFGGVLPLGYPSKPMDFGTITGKLFEGYYSSLEEFESDCKLVVDNCLQFNGNIPENKNICDQARRLGATMQQQFDNLKRYMKSSAAQTAQKAAQLAISTSTLPKPPIPLLLSVLTELRDVTYTDKLTKIAEPAMAHFEKPVSIVSFPDYMTMIPSPMDLQTVERKTKTGQYWTPEDFEYDAMLIFQNCITYNTQRKNDHLVALGKFGLKSFRRIFNAKMKVVDDPSLALTLKPPSMESGIRKEPPVGGADQGPNKKAKIDTSSASRPRITLTISDAQKAAAQGRKSPKLPSSDSASKLKPNQPVPLHIAIAKVKERFPLRRNVKNLQPWETACARLYKELMRHPWISAARPKFIFHVPVPVLFPALKEAYETKIKKPMDLTSVECTLLVGNRYAKPEDFVNDLALVFSNAITFNKDGRDVGDPLSCAYYDASIHLLKYTRWLSLECLSDYVQESDHVDEPETIGLPVASWKLTTGNKRKSRNEMEAIVFKEPIEKSLEGDKFTWTEAECERLLKSLRHQSDYKYMSFFLYPNYPADYAAYITRAMDWEKVQKTLKKRHYETIGNVIDDLRLIFKNALKYNSRHAGTDSVSGRAYDAAQIMSAKLETAINKCMLTVSDRVERERIDHNNAEREIEAAEKAEEAKIREQWKKEGKDPNTADPSLLTVEGAQRIRSAKRIILRRKSETDFEVPFFDEEDDGQHERSYFLVMKKQKETFERQQSELIRMRFATGKIGQSVYNRMAQEQLALQWITAEQKKLGMAVPSDGVVSVSANAEASAGSADPSQPNHDGSEPSAVLAKLDQKDREPLKLSLTVKGSKKMKKNALASKKKKDKALPKPPADFGSDDEDDTMEKL